MNTRNTNWDTEISNMLNVKYPIVQAPMFGVTSPQMVAAAIKAQCLGVLALGDTPADKCAEAIHNTKQLTDGEFAVNIFVNQIPEITDDLKKKYTATKKFIALLAKEYGLEVDLPQIDQLKINSYHEQIDAIISESCKIVSFTFGNLDKESIDKLKSMGTILIGTCTSVNEAEVLEKSGIDIVCVQGIEAGGHRGSFSDEHVPEIGGLSLLSKVRDSVKVPLIYAGGIYNARTLLAAQTLGAQGFQIGSLLLGSAESALKDFEKQRLRSVKEEDIVLTKSFSGRYARGIENAFIKAVDCAQNILPYPYQNKLTAELRKRAKASGNIDFVSIWAGQSIGRYSGESTAHILRDLIQEVDNIK